MLLICQGEKISVKYCKFKIYSGIINELLCCRNITEKQIEEIFNGFGRIVQKNILKDKLTGLPRGVAFVR